MISRRGTRRSGAASGVAKILREEGSGPVVTAGNVVSGFWRMFMRSSCYFLGAWRWLSSLRGAKRRSNPESSRDSGLLRFARNDGVSGLCRSSRRLRLHGQPRAHARVGVGVLGDVGNDGDGIRAGRENLGGVLELDAADRNQRDVADAFLPFADLRDPLRREAHRLQRGEEDRAERDIVRLSAERGGELLIIMGGDTEGQPRVADRLEVGIRKILLAQM